MFRLAMRSVLARWARLVLTGLAIVASTSFLAGTFVFRDTIERTFDALFADVYDRVDAYVQSSNSVENFLGFERRDRLPSDVVEQVQAVPGVADAQASVQGDAVIIGPDGQPLERPTAPTFGATVNSGELSLWKVIEGRLPDGPTEMVMDSVTAADEGFAVGDAVKVNAEAGSRDFTLVGIVQYDAIISPGNATWALFDAATAEEFVAKPGFVDAVLVRGDGTMPAEELVQRIAAALGGLDQVGSQHIGDPPHRAGQRDVCGRSEGFDQPDGDGLRVNAHRAAGGGGVATGLERTEGNRAGGFDAQQRSVDRQATGARAGRRADQRVVELGAARGHPQIAPVSWPANQREVEGVAPML